MNSEEKYEK